MDHGWIKLHRKLVDWEWYQDIPVKILFLHLILVVNYEEKKWRGETIKIGEIVTSLAHLAEQTRMSVQSVRTALDKLESTGEVTRTSTNRFTKITLIKWEEYQGKEDKPTHRATNKQQTNNKQTTTTKEIKKERSKEEDNNTASGDAEKINLIMEKFQMLLNSTINYGNKTQRKAIQDLLALMGEEKLIRTIEYASSISGEQFAPMITTPYQLKEKLAQLKAYYERSLKPKKGMIKSI